MSDKAANVDRPGYTLREPGALVMKPRIFGEHGGCFAAGTQIQLANGEVKPIEALTPATPQRATGDVLLSPGGVRVYVVATISGPQPKGWPLLRISATAQRDGATVRHEVEVTHNHTMVRGLTRLLQVSALRVGDSVRSVHGESQVDAIEPVAYDGRTVWSLYLASQRFVEEVLPAFAGDEPRLYDALYYGWRSSLLTLSANEHLVFSNGFLTGDYSLQTQIEERLRTGLGIDEIN